MIDPERERIDPFIVTTKANLSDDGIICAHCGKVLSKYNKQSDSHQPQPENLLANGTVPVPNFGWFCSQVCGNAYSEKFGVAFQRNVKGEITYYD